MYRKLGEIWICGFWDKQTYKPTDRETDSHADCNTLHPYKGVKYKAPTDLNVINRQTDSQRGTEHATPCVAMRCSLKTDTD